MNDAPAAKDMPRPRPAYASPCKDGGWQVLIWAQPGAKKTEFVGERDGCLRVRLAAPAVENKANKALLAAVAGALGLKQADLRLAAGESGRRKRLIITTDAEPDWTRLAVP